MANGRFVLTLFAELAESDEESILAGAAYGDLNPIRAAIAQTLEESHYTSANMHIEERLTAFLARGKEGTLGAVLAISSVRYALAQRPLKSKLS